LNLESNCGRRDGVASNLESNFGRRDGVALNLERKFGRRDGVALNLESKGSIFLFTTAGDRKRQKTTLVRVQLEQHSAHRISIAARARQVFLSVCITTVLPLPIKIKNLQKLRALRARGVLLI
jgi:hypothetical protein